MTTQLHPNTWPHQRECEHLFGRPSYGAWERHHITTVSCPWKIYDADSNRVISGIQINRYAASSLERVLAYIWEQVGQSQSEIQKLHYHIFSGSFVVRPIRGGHKASMHAYGLAIDWDDHENQQHSRHHLFTDDSLLVRAFKAEGWTWGGDWSLSSIDPMHVQAAQVF